MDLSDDQKSSLERAIMAGMIKKAKEGDVRAARYVSERVAESKPTLTVVGDGARIAVLSTRIPQHVREGLEQMAKAQGLTISGLAAQILAGAVEEIGDDGDEIASDPTWDAGF